jgi:hypothetical protein
VQRRPQTPTTPYSPRGSEVGRDPVGGGIIRLFDDLLDIAVRVDASKLIVEIHIDWCRAVTDSQ